MMVTRLKRGVANCGAVGSFAFGAANECNSGGKGEKAATFYGDGSS